eukprot:scaffold50383_cov35-Tisochrysis_lutea.AAC.3
MHSCGDAWARARGMMAACHPRSAGRVLKPGKYPPKHVEQWTRGASPRAHPELRTVTTEASGWLTGSESE